MKQQSSQLTIFLLTFMKSRVLQLHQEEVDNEDASNTACRKCFLQLLDTGK